ncbi:OmpA family protein [Rhodoferax sp. TBRC 17660]|uniref:OmpA family protein n=1 Tax=Rhodoferax potami TaxID=3068338 RepID=A0ABU3KRM7_9BURK|nr:OmpA family protein [Rhodoferax sp. TBRC 17660]MDT7520466.1 OmpA family protein [Rhodoferax sp. TBRC 17660]
MKHHYLTPAAWAIAILLGACASAPTSTSLLESARSDYAQAQRNANVNNFAPLEMKQASDAMQEANLAAMQSADSDKVDQLAYVARQKIAITQEVVKQKTAEVDMARSGRERDQLQLTQRTNEVNQANNAERQAMDAQRATDAARQATTDANRRTALLESQLADLAAKKTDRGMVITLGDVLFGSDKASLTAGGLRSAQKLAEVLQQNPTRNVLVEGFTDSTGADPYNQQLSERRGQTVRDALLQMGVGSERISVRGYGESYPVASNDTAANRQLNRRVEIVLSDESGKTPQR